MAFRCRSNYVDARRGQHDSAIVDDVRDAVAAAAHDGDDDFDVVETWAAASEIRHDLDHRSSTHAVVGALDCTC